MSCSGVETKLSLCPTYLFGTNGCAHSEDVGIACQGKRAGAPCAAHARTHPLQCSVEYNWSTAGFPFASCNSTCQVNGVATCVASTGETVSDSLCTALAGAAAPSVAACLPGQGACTSAPTAAPSSEPTSAPSLLPTGTCRTLLPAPLMVIRIRRTDAFANIEPFVQPERAAQCRAQRGAVEPAER
jgi:hypothetical protein